MKQLETPVLLIIFNRPDTTHKVFEQIRLARPKKLFLAADGPRKNHPRDEETCKKTRKIVEKIDWPCDVKTRFHETNLGCGIAPSTAIDWFFEHIDQGIILEDDCLPNQSFFDRAQLHQLFHPSQLTYYTLSYDLKHSN